MLRTCGSRRLAGAVGGVRHALAESLESRRLLASKPLGDDLALPRSITAAERVLLERSTSTESTTRATPTAAPLGPVDPVAEYDAMEGLVISWRGSSAWLNNLIQIARRVTVEGNSRVYCGVTPGANIPNISAAFAAGGANVDRMTFFTVSVDSIWARDYGPRYVYEGDVRVITDHQYNRPRPNDDNQPVAFAALKGHKLYTMGAGAQALIHGGGNYHLDTNGDAYATQLLVNENQPPFTTTALSAAQIKEIYADFQNNSLTLTPAFPTSVDATQHIDMWMQIYDTNKVFISDWPNNSGSTQDVICDNQATLMQSRGYAVTRIPAYSIGGVHYTFANMVICNNVVLLPQYNNGPGATVSTNVFNTVQTAFNASGRTVFQINADSIVQAAGVFHCIVQHIPRHRGAVGTNGGLAPTALLNGPASGTLFASGQTIDLSWITDDDGPTTTTGVQDVRLELSLDGGTTWPTLIASNLPRAGSFSWALPAGLQSDQAVVRAVARDAADNTGSHAGQTFSLDTRPPSSLGAEFAFESEHRVDVLPDELSSIESSSLVNLTSGDTLEGDELQITSDNLALSVRSTAGLLADGSWRLNYRLRDAAGNLGAPASYDFHVLAGDANRDRSVDFADLLVVAQNYSQSGRSFSQGNVDYSSDGLVDFSDLLILAQRYGTQLLTPEPTRPDRSLRRRPDVQIGELV